MDDASVEVRLDDGWEHLGSVNQRVERCLDEEDRFLGHLVTERLRRLAEVREQAGKDQHDDAGEFKELFNVLGQLVVISLFLFSRSRVGEAKVPRNLDNHPLDVKAFGKHEAVKEVHCLGEDGLPVDCLPRHARVQNLL